MMTEPPLPDQASSDRPATPSGADPRHFFDHAPDLLAVLRSDSTPVWLGGPWATTLGWHSDRLAGRPLTDLVHPEDREAAANQGFRTTAMPPIPQRGRWQRADGEWHWLEWRASNTDPDGLVYAIGRDIADEVESEKERLRREIELQELAMRDPLTALPNRLLLMDLLEQALARCERSGGQVQVLFCDIDDFKAINDELGHAAGDEALIEVANRLRGSFRASDTVARIGGDEFVIVVEEDQGTGAHIVRERVERAIRTPLTVGGRDFMVGIAIGSAVGSPSSDPESLIAEADRDMYARKRRAGAVRP